MEQSQVLQWIKQGEDSRVQFKDRNLAWHLILIGNSCMAPKFFDDANADQFTVIIPRPEKRK